MSSTDGPGASSATSRTATISTPPAATLPVGWAGPAGSATWFRGVRRLPRVARRALALPDSETLARHAPLADFVFALQGLGAGPVTLYGTDEQRRAILSGHRARRAIAAFALSEQDAGSDVAAMRTTRPRGRGYVIDGEKTGISTPASPITT